MPWESLPGSVSFVMCCWEEGLDGPGGEVTSYCPMFLSALLILEAGLSVSCNGLSPPFPPIAPTDLGKGRCTPDAKGPVATARFF